MQSGPIVTIARRFCLGWDEALGQGGKSVQLSLGQNNMSPAHHDHSIDLAK